MLEKEKAEKKQILEGIGNCEICGKNEFLYQILGDDNKMWHVCKSCLKEQWKIDLDKNKEECRAWREKNSPSDWRSKR